MTLPLDKLPDWPAWMSARTAAAYLDIAEGTLRTRDDMPKPFRDGRIVRWSRADLDDYIARRRPDGVQSPRPKKRLGEKAGDHAG